MIEVDKSMAEAAININSRRGLGGSGMISFPVSSDATTAVEDFAKGDLAIVVLCIDIAAETINLDFGQSSLDLNFAEMDEIKSGKGLTEPRFILFRYKDEKVIFANTCPGTSKIKERYGRA
jgi:hypothetical protein